MFLALREIRRSVVRYSLLVLAVGLLVFLILFQQALQDGLITSFVGGIRNQSAPVLVYSVDAQRTLQGSAMPPPLEEQVRSVDEVGESARVGQSTFTVRIGDGDETDAAVLGTDDQEVFRPTSLSGGRWPTTDGEAVGSDADFSVGDEVQIVAPPPADPVMITVVGVAADVQLSVTPTLFTDLATFDASVQATNPDATSVLPNAIAMIPAEGVSDAELVAAVNAAAPDAESLTRADAADKSPGVAQVRQSFQVIFLLYGLVVPLVTGLFFLILTLQKSGSLTLLRAMGARGGVLVRSLLFQVLVVISLGLALGIALYYSLSQFQVGGLSLRFDPTVVLVWSTIVVVLGLISALASMRKVLKINPIEATTGGGLR